MDAIHDWIVERAGYPTADAYMDQLDAACQSLELASERGRRQDDLLKGLRVIGFKNTDITFVVEADRVLILRLFHGGKNWQNPAHWSGR